MTKKAELLLAKREAKLGREIERFKKISACVSTDRSDEANVFTSYADGIIDGLSLRDYEQAYATRYFAGQKEDLHLRWFLKRPNHRALYLGDKIEAPDEVRRWAQGLLDGRENAIVSAYIDNTPDVDRHDCSCFCTSELLMGKTLDELEVEVFSMHQWLAAASERPSFARRHACILVPQRCELRHLVAMLKRYAKFREREGLEIKIKTKPQRQAA